MPIAEEASPPIVPIAEIAEAAAAPIITHIISRSHNKVDRVEPVVECVGL